MDPCQITRFTPPDFFLWDNFKSKVYENDSCNLNDIEANIWSGDRFDQSGRIGEHRVDGRGLQ